MQTTLVSDFEAGSIDNATFSHRDHVYVIWSLIHEHGTLEAIRRFEDSLKRITESVGHPEKYNATITYSLAFLTAEAIAADPDMPWLEFEALHPDLFEWPNARLAALYPDGGLHTDAARRMYILPTAR